MSFKIGDKVRLTGLYWDGDDAPTAGEIITIKEVSGYDDTEAFFQHKTTGFWSVYHRNHYSAEQFNDWGGVIVTDEEPTGDTISADLPLIKSQTNQVLRIRSEQGADTLSVLINSDRGSSIFTLDDTELDDFITGLQYVRMMKNKEDK